jgi:hypothetical protein
MLEARLTELRRDLIEYATLAEGMIDSSIQGLVNKDRELLQRVVDKDEPIANATEIELDDNQAIKCLREGVIDVEPGQLAAKLYVLPQEYGKGLFGRGLRSGNFSSSSPRLKML